MAQVAGLVGNEPYDMKSLTEQCGHILVNHGRYAGVEVADGKFEFLLGPDREFYVGDTGLSSDENRLLVELDVVTYVDLSKQLVRNIHTIRFPEWKEALKRRRNNTQTMKNNGLRPQTSPRKKRNSLQIPTRLLLMRLRARVMKLTFIALLK